MKMRSKGKVHPSPSPCSSDAFSVLKLLPAAILGVISTVLSVEEKQVLAYMITRSIRSSTAATITKSSAAHKTPAFHCDCFQCYTNYWCKWDSSPNRQLIHQAIEAFEDHFTIADHHQSILFINNNNNNNNNTNNNNSRAKKRDKMSRRQFKNAAAAAAADKPPREEEIVLAPIDVVEIEGSFVHVYYTDRDDDDDDVHVRKEEAEQLVVHDDDIPLPPEEEEEMAVRAYDNHKGLARKVLPDVLGLFNSRLWSLWTPNL